MSWSPFIDDVELKMRSGKIETDLFKVETDSFFSPSPGNQFRKLYRSYTLKCNGDFHVNGDIKLENAQDCAEEFDVWSGPVEPGTVMVLLKHFG